MYWSVVLLILFTSLTASIDGKERVSVLTNGFVQYEPIDWRVGETLKFVVYYETNSPNGTICSILAHNGTGTLVLNQTTHIKSGSAKVSFEMEGGASGSSWSPNNATDGAIHKVQITLFEDDEGNARLSSQIDGTKRNHVISGHDLNFLSFGDQLKVSLILGDVNGNGVAGCFEHDVTLNGNTVSLTKSKERQSSDLCLSPCNNGLLQCQNGGQCTDLTFLRSACDCHSTGYSGDTCEIAASTVVLSSDSTEIYYRLKKFEDVKRIALDFKPQPGNTRRQKIVYTQIWDQVTETSATGRELVLYFKYSWVPILEIDEVRKEFAEIQPTDGSWHSFILTIDYENRSMNATLDKEIFIFPFAGWRSEELFVWTEKKDKGINFAGKGEDGLSGCIRNAYVDHHQILELVENGDDRVGSSSPLNFTACPFKDPSKHGENVQPKHGENVQFSAAILVASLLFSGLRGYSFH